MSESSFLKVLKALSHSVRLKILSLLKRPLTVQELAEKLNTSRQRIEHHLDVLIDANLVSRLIVDNRVCYVQSEAGKKLRAIREVIEGTVRKEKAPHRLIKRIAEVSFADYLFVLLLTASLLAFALLVYIALVELKLGFIALGVLIAVSTFVLARKIREKLKPRFLCPSCEARVEADFNYCPFCGEKL